MLLVLDGPWQFDQIWILLGLTGYAASFVTGIAFISPHAARIARVAEERGPNDPEVGRLDGWTLVAGAAALGAAAVLSYRSFRRSPVAGAAPAVAD